MIARIQYFIRYLVGWRVSRRSLIIFLTLLPLVITGNFIYFEIPPAPFIIKVLTFNKILFSINPFNELIIFIFLAFILAIILFIASFLLGKRIGGEEKVSAYECGFDPFEDARQPFDVRFYLVTILFIIFDLEVTFLFPWSLVLDKIGFFGYTIMLIFLIVLTAGLVYEWWSGALDWE